MINYVHDKRGIGKMENNRQEISEALKATRDTLVHLRRAQEALGSARSWGIFDMVGGGFFSTFIKRGKIGDAKQALEQARACIQNLAKELRDVEQALHVDIVTDDFLSFADYFFDGFVADWLVQSRITKARTQVAQAIDKVASIQNHLAAL